MGSREDFHGRGGSGATALALTALLLVLGALLPTGALAATGSISGTVTKASNPAEPIEEVPVAAIWVEGESEEGVRGGYGVTGSDGTYAISNLAPGKYKVFFSGEQQGYVSQYYPDKRTFEEATVLTVEPAGLTGIDAELVMGARIEGVVRAAASGGPVSRIMVCPLDAETGTQASYCAETASDGSYVIGGLQAGDYKVEFSAGASGEALLPQFYDHKASLAEAATLHLETAEVMRGIDADLQAEPAPPAQVEAAPVLSSPPPLFSAPPSSTPPVTHRHCRKGTKKRRLKGKLRCVRVRHRHRRHHHHRHPASSGAGRAAVDLHR